MAHGTLGPSTPTLTPIPEAGRGSLLSFLPVGIRPWLGVERWPSLWSRRTCQLLTRAGRGAKGGVEP